MTVLADKPVRDVATHGAHEAHGGPRLAHHVDTLPQQFEASKLGMWMFLATEVLLFGGLFCGYAIWRSNHPEMFRYGSQYLDTTWGAVNTVVLILSSVTAATAVTSAQRSRRTAMCVLLALTLLGGAVFMSVKYVEYSHKIRHNLVPVLAFYEDPHPQEHAQAVARAVAPGDAARGRTLWMGTCRSCHGVGGEGITGQGKDIRGSEFIAGKTDEELVTFIKAGRMPFDPLNTTGTQMPPRGGNPLLKDPDLRDVVAFVRTFEKPPEGTGQGAAEAGTPTAAGPEAPPSEYIPKSTIPPAASGPAGVLLAALEPPAPEPRGHPPLLPSRDEARPRNAHMFFTFYFLMTGLHGLHVLAGMAVMTWLLLGAVRGRYTSAWFTPVDLGALYWHVVDLIWIFLFPLFYLT